MIALAAPPDVHQLTRIVTAAVLRKRRMFDAFPDIAGRRNSIEDLVQHCMPRALQMHDTYDAARSQYSTWITCGVNRAILDYYKSRAAEGRRIDVLKGEAREQEFDPKALDEIRDWFDAGETMGMPGGAGGDDETTEDWLAGVYRFASRVFPERQHPCRGNNWFTPAQIVCVALLRRKRHLSIRGVRQLLQADEDLRKAIKLKSVPSHGWFQTAVGRTVQYLRPDGGGHP